MKVISPVSLFRIQFIEPIVPEVKEEHFSNAPSLIVVTLSGMLMDVKEEQEENASHPISVTLSGMVTEVKEEQAENAWVQIFVIPSPRMILLIFFFNRGP